MHTVAMWCTFVDGDRSAARQHLEVGVTGRLAMLSEQLVVVFANDLLVASRPGVRSCCLPARTVRDGS